LVCTRGSPLRYTHVHGYHRLTFTHYTTAFTFTGLRRLDYRFLPLDLRWLPLYVCCTFVSFAFTAPVCLRCVYARVYYAVVYSSGYCGWLFGSHTTVYRGSVAALHTRRYTTGLYVATFYVYTDFAFTVVYATHHTRTFIRGYIVPHLRSLVLVPTVTTRFTRTRFNVGWLPGSHVYTPGCLQFTLRARLVTPHTTFWFTRLLPRLGFGLYTFLHGFTVGLRLQVGCCLVTVYVRTGYMQLLVTGCVYWLPFTHTYAPLRNALGYPRFTTLRACVPFVHTAVLPVTFVHV